MTLLLSCRAREVTCQNGHVNRFCYLRTKLAADCMTARRLHASNVSQLRRCRVLVVDADIDAQWDTLSCDSVYGNDVTPTAVSYRRPSVRPSVCLSGILLRPCPT